MKIIVLLIILVFQSVAAQKTVEDAARAGKCDTRVVFPLSRQLIDEMQCLVPGLMKSVDGIAKIQKSASVFPFLQTPAANALIKAVNRDGRTIFLNSALRTLAQQYLLRRWFELGLCGITAAATPGRSNHNGGLALDVRDASTWTSSLGKEGWKFFGPGDPVHFDFKGAGGRDVREISTKAFQRLWNRNNPKDKIAEDGAFGPATELRLQRSPITGFPKGAICTPKRATLDTVDTCTASGVSGTCIDTADCTGTSTPGLCPGPTNIQCCTNSATIPLDKCTITSGVSGTCQNISACPGVSTPGFCPGPANIQCCTAGTPNTIPVTLTVNQAGIDLIKSFEGFAATIIADPVGVPTVGFGHNCEVFDCTNLQAKDSNGIFREIFIPLTRESATDLLRADLSVFEDCVRSRISPINQTITRNQFSALVSFTFNVGCGAFSSSTLLKRVLLGANLEGNNGIRAAFLLFNKGGGQVLPGLTRRRNAEADLYGDQVRSLPIVGNVDGVGDDCFLNGEKGVCLKIADCTGKRAVGLCPGPVDVQCCISNKCAINSASNGTCLQTSHCQGSPIPGKCFGATDVQCCPNNIPASKISSLCPAGSTFDKTAMFCTQGSNAVLGPFPAKMTLDCGAQFGAQCNQVTTVSLTNGNQVRVPQWERKIFEKLRGGDICPPGTAVDSFTLGWCVENNATAEGSKLVYGEFDGDSVKVCTDMGAGASCFLPRWNQAFFLSVAGAQTGMSIVENTLIVNDVDGNDDATEIFNPFFDLQAKLSSEVEVVPVTSGIDLNQPIIAHCLFLGILLLVF